MEPNKRLAGLLIGVMQPDIVLPSQHFGPQHRQAPEQRLMIAVLQDALDCVQKHRFAKDAHRRQAFREARRWFLAGETDWPYSFECICDTLDLDADAVRRRLRVGRKPPEREAMRVELRT